MVKFGTYGYWLAGNKSSRMKDRRRLRRYARRMQDNPTPAEAAIWAHLRTGRHGTWWFQYTFSPLFIADFYNRRYRLVVEIDGGYHEEPEQRLRDAERERLMGADGIMVIRFKNEDVMADPASVIARICRRVRSLAVMEHFRKRA